MTLESCSASTLSLEPNCASVERVAHDDGRPVSITRRTMLSQMAPLGSVIASRLHVARRAHAGFARQRALGGGSPREQPASSSEQDQPLLGAGDLDHGVEHGLEQLVDARVASSASR